MPDRAARAIAALDRMNATLAERLAEHLAFASAASLRRYIARNPQCSPTCVCWAVSAILENHGES